ncbi:MAG: hypothetical protein FRX49_03734 [Trebouxia sp. A1-2]|nr:MAG: hypothetical protein FRX49_03734 [Trebouxia sp. A1-2]
MGRRIHRWGAPQPQEAKATPDAMLFFPLKVWASYLLLCIALQQPAARASQWETVHETSSNVWGGRRTPPVRFSHAAVVLNDQVVITHGFFYDVEARASQWLSDTWSMSTQSPYTWHKLHRSDMDEVYTYDPGKHSWTFINARGKKPAPRYLHSAVVVNNAMLVFGGTEKTAGDVWSFSFKKLSWTRLSHPVALSKGGPGSMYAHCTVAAADGTGFIVHGGRHVDGDLSNVMWYSHCANVFEDQLVITHGYFYNTEVKGPQWLSDAWLMSLQSPFAMKQIHKGVTDTAAASTYSKKQTPPVPSGRYGSTSVAYKNQLWMFAGTDGGYSKHGNGGYELGYDMDELYVFDIKSHSWELVLPKGQRPAARYLHSAVVVGDSMVIFGGNDKASGDVWSFQFAARRWKLLSKVVPMNKGGPGSIFAHSAVATADDSGFLVFGGQYVDDNLIDDVWYFNIEKRKWRKMAVYGPKNSKPAPRSFQEMAAVPWHGHVHSESGNITKIGEQATVAVFTGGSTRTPLLLCTAETWLMIVNPHTRQQVWERLPDLPYGIYYHKVVVHDNFAYVTGGHLCSETKGDMPNYYLNHVLRLDLSPWLDDRTSSTQQLHHRIELKHAA